LKEGRRRRGKKKSRRIMASSVNCVVLGFPNFATTRGERAHSKSQDSCQNRNSQAENSWEGKTVRDEKEAELQRQEEIRKST